MSLSRNISASKFVTSLTKVGGKYQSVRVDRKPKCVTTTETTGWCTPGETKSNGTSSVGGVRRIKTWMSGRPDMTSGRMVTHKGKDRVLLQLETPKKVSIQIIQTSSLLLKFLYVCCGELPLHTFLLFLPTSISV